MTETAITGSFGIITFRSNNANKNGVSDTYEAFAAVVRRLVGHKRVTLSRDNKSIVVITAMESVSAAASMAGAHELKVDATFDCVGELADELFAAA